MELEWRRRWRGMAWRGAQGLRWNWPGIVIPNNSAGVELQFQGTSDSLDNYTIIIVIDSCSES